MGKAGDSTDLAARDRAMRGKLRVAMSARWNDPNERKRLKAAIRKAMTPTVRLRLAEAQRARWAKWRAARAASEGE
jgi:hypothetical protein